MGTDTGWGQQPGSSFLPCCNSGSPAQHTPEAPTLCSSLSWCWALPHIMDDSLFSIPGLVKSPSYRPSATATCSRRPSWLSAAFLLCDLGLANLHL
jgi:hypothetical protein